MKEFFYDYLLPLAIQFGMSVKEFWNEEPNLLWTYRKSYMDKIKLDSELSNYNAWLNGLYIFNAINVNLYNCFARKDGQAVKNYVEEPYDFSRDKKEIERERQREEEQQIKNALSRMKGALNNKQ